MVSSATTETQGIVACVASNGRGLKLDGQDNWLNRSKWSEVESIPPRGSPVVLGIDRSGLVRSIATDVQPTATEIAPAMLTCRGGAATRQKQITRMACLNTATAILSRNGIVSVAVVLETAYVLEAWVTR